MQEGGEERSTDTQNSHSHDHGFPEDQELDSPPGFAFPELPYLQQEEQSYLYSELSSSTSTPFVSAPSSPSRMRGFYFSAPTSPSWTHFISFTTNIPQNDNTLLSSGDLPQEETFFPRRSFHGNSTTPWEDLPNDHTPSILLSSSSEFEFSSRFSDSEDPPMSPTLISCSSCFQVSHQNHHLIQTTPFDNHLSCTPPNPNNFCPSKSKLDCEMHENTLTFLSAPQSPSRGGYQHAKLPTPNTKCGVSHPLDETNKHHRRARSSSPSRVFDWNDRSSRSNSNSRHGKDVQRGAKYDMPKNSKRWNFKGFLHWKTTKDSSKDAKSSNSSSLRSSGRSSCSSYSVGESSDDVGDDNFKLKGMRLKGHKKDTRINGKNSDEHNVNLSMTRSSNRSGSRKASLLSPSSSSSSTSSSSSSASTSFEHVSNGKLNAHKATKGPYAQHYTRQRAQTEELRKRTFLPYKQSLLGCLGISGKSYRAMATLSKPLQSLS